MFVLERQSEGSVGLGSVLAIGLYLAQTIMLLLILDFREVSLATSLPVIAFVPPLSQFLYIAPIYFERKRSNKSSTSSGLLAGAIVMGLIHMAIFGVITLSK